MSGMTFSPARLRGPAAPGPASGLRLGPAGRSYLLRIRLGASPMASYLFPPCPSPGEDMVGITSYLAGLKVGAYD